MIDIISWVGSACFALCALPEVLNTHRTKQCTLSWGFLSLWFVGEALCIIAATGKSQWWLLGNYIPNFLCLLYMIKVKISTT